MIPPLRALMLQTGGPGRVDWIGLRPARRAALRPVHEAAIVDAGLVGDHGRPGARAVTLIQSEHLPVIAALAGRDDVTPDVLRRNVVVAGINLAALRGRALQLGAAVVEITGPCAPCSRMAQALGPAGYAAMRGHGGWCARVLAPGALRIGDLVEAKNPPTPGG